MHRRDRETERVYKTGVVIMSVTVVTEGSCEKEGESELKNCRKEMAIVISGSFRHMQAFIPTRDARQPSTFRSYKTFKVVICP